MLFSFDVKVTLFAGGAGLIITVVREPKMLDDGIEIALLSLYPMLQFHLLCVALPLLFLALCRELMIHIKDFMFHRANFLSVLVLLGGDRKWSVRLPRQVSMNTIAVSL